MKCPECNNVMEKVVLDKAGLVWICDDCGLTLADGTSSLDLHTVTSDSFT